jgi:hypothetical protein
MPDWLERTVRARQADSVLQWMKEKQDVVKTNAAIVQRLLGVNQLLSKV